MGGWVGWMSIYGLLSFLLLGLGSWVEPGCVHKFTSNSLTSSLSLGNDRMLQSREGRIRMTMFPETIQEGEEVPSTQVAPNQPTSLQRLAQPAQILKAAVSSLASYQVSWLHLGEE